MDEATNQLEFEGDGEGEGYEVEAIRDSVVCSRESDSGHIPGLCYLIS